MNHHIQSRGCGARINVARSFVAEKGHVVNSSKVVQRRLRLDNADKQHSQLLSGWLQLCRRMRRCAFSHLFQQHRSLKKKASGCFMQQNNRGPVSL